MRGFMVRWDMDRTKDALEGISEREQEIMLRLLRTPRQQQKDAPKPMSVQGIAQRRRREKERQRPTSATSCD
jgi:hypothetical protein